MFGFESQLSVAIGAVNTGDAGHSIVPSAPWPLNTGGVVSSIVIVCDTVIALLPAQSVAVHVLVTVPVPHASRLNASVDIITGDRSQLSVTTGSVNTGDAGHWIVASDPWPLNTGGVVSSVVIV